MIPKQYFKKDGTEVTVIPNFKNTRWYIMVKGKDKYGMLDDVFNAEKEALAKAEEYSKE